MLTTIIYFSLRFGSCSVEVPPGPTLYFDRVGCGRSLRTTLTGGAYFGGAAGVQWTRNIFLWTGLR